MRKTLSRLMITIVIVSTLLLPFSNILAANKGVGSKQDYVIEKVRALIPGSVQMTDRAIETLSKGLNGMSPRERDVFEMYFDPGDRGELDEVYTMQVLENFKKIRNRLNSNITLIFEESSKRCELMTLYYTDFVRIHICPYAAQETNTRRMARGIVHEAAHMTFLAFDRSYYYADYSAYKALKPQVHPAAHIPLIGYVIREVLRNDTFYNADTYAKYAAELSIPEEVSPQGDSDHAEYDPQRIFSPEMKFSDVGH